ncbi:MAG: hypothetical protein U9P63_03785 [Patescibacteria group bacterium]|nr:hypothetical protein [Patescibacteria group bacterium]
MKEKFYFLIGVIALFFTGCVAASGDNWKADIVSDMRPEITAAGDYGEDASKGLDIFFEFYEGEYIRTLWNNVQLVPKDKPNAPSFGAARVRIISRAKEEAGMGKFLLDVDMKGEIAFSETFNNPAVKYGEPFIDGYWGIGVGRDGSPGFIMIDPDSRWVVYKTVLFGGYKTKSGDRADLNTLLVGVVYYKNKPPRPLKEVLAENGVKVGDFVSANKWRYCPELAD